MASWPPSTPSRPSSSTLAFLSSSAPHSFKGALPIRALSTCRAQPSAFPLRHSEHRRLRYPAKWNTSRSHYNSSFVGTDLAAPSKLRSARPVSRYSIIATMAKGGENTNDDTPPASDSQSPVTDSADLPSKEEGENLSDQRPYWAPQWLPTSFLKMRDRPLVQMSVLLPLYAVHLFLFSTKGWKLKRAIIPNRKNLFQSIGYDSIAGAIVATIFLIWRRWAMQKRLHLEAEAPKPSDSIEENSGDGSLMGNLLRVNDPPWRVPREAKRKIGQTTLLLFVAYLASGYGAVFSEQILYLLAGSGVPLTVATTRAWKVLLGHLMWVYMGIGILRRLKPFFPEKGTWLKWKWKSNWLWWAIGGYYVSALFFNMADVLNQLVLPASLFEEETVVSKLINPENKDRVAMAIGSIGPCVSAPVFEEVLYRGFLLPALACFLPMWAAIPASSVLFAVHHLNPTMIVPLSMLGFIWAILYAKSGNLLVTILIHAMWNSRVFLGSLLGLGTFTDFE